MESHVLCHVCGYEDRWWIEYLRHCLNYGFQEIIDYGKHIRDQEIMRLSVSSLANHFRKHTSWESYLARGKELWFPEYVVQMVKSRNEYKYKKRPVPRYWKD